MFKRDDLQNRFKILLTGWWLFATLKILVILLVIDLTSISKTQCLVLKMAFSNSMFSTKISDVAKCFYSSLVLLLIDLTISTKMTFWLNSLKMIKILTVSGIQEVRKNDFF